MVEDMLAARGIIVSHQQIRLWAEKIGRYCAKDIRKRSAGRLGDKWHLDEVVLTTRDKKHWLWRAVDQNWLCSRCSRPEPPKCQGGKAFDAQAAERTGPTTACHDHRQASVLWCSTAGDHAWYRAPVSQRLEQPSREFSSADPTMGTDQAFQVSRSDTALRLHPRPNRQLFYIPRHEMHPGIIENCGKRQCACGTMSLASKPLEHRMADQFLTKAS
jgi:hypothetical protein